MKRMIHLSVLALALAPALALAQAAPSATPYPQWDELTPAQRDALVTPLRERWDAALQRAQASLAGGITDWVVEIEGRDRSAPRTATAR